MNMEFVNICYKFINRFIVVDKLIDELTEFNKKYNIKEVDGLLNDIKDLNNKFPNTKDDYVNKEKAKIKKMIDSLEKDDTNNEFVNKTLNNLKKMYDKEIDSYDRWKEVFTCIIKNDYLNKNMEELSDEELYDFITQYIQAPLPPNLSQEDFDKLVNIGISKDDREGLWRLAFNYEGKEINLNDIVNYFIDMKDDYYLSELISAVGVSLDIDKIIDKLNDKKFISDLLERKSAMGSQITKEQLSKLENKL